MQRLLDDLIRSIFGGDSKSCIVQGSGFFSSAQLTFDVVRNRIRISVEPDLALQVPN